MDSGSRIWNLSTFVLLWYTMGLSQALRCAASLSDTSSLYILRKASLTACPVTLGRPSASEKRRKPKPCTRLKGRASLTSQRATFWM